MSMNVIDVGTPPDDISDGWATTLVRFHEFANLPSTRGDDYTESPRFSCCGRQWCLQICPGGDEDSTEGYVAVLLVNKSDVSIKIQFNYCVRDRSGKEVVTIKSEIEEFDACGSEENAWGNFDFAKRSKLMTLLVNGSLVIEIRMKSPTTDKSITQFIPANPFNKNVSELFMNEETADVVFEVGGEQQGKGKRKRTKISTTNFHAHRNILQKCAPTLYEMCGKSDEGGIITVSITDVKPEIFKHMLSYVYGGKLSEDELDNNAKEIINACDKYGVVNLKLETEAAYVKSNEITMDNMMGNLLYADSKNLALLKEAVMDYIVANKKRIIGKVSFDSVPGGLITDVLTAVARGEDDNSDDEDDESTKYNTMRVGTLRKMLDKKGLDVDGSREAMIALLKENNDSDCDEEDDDDEENDD